MTRSSPLTRLAERNEAAQKLITERDEIKNRLTFMRRKLISLRVAIHRYGSSPVTADKRKVAEETIDKIVRARAPLKHRLAEITQLLKRDRAIARRARASITPIVPKTIEETPLVLEHSPLDDELAKIWSD